MTNIQPRPRRPRASQKQIAQLAGVAQSTVSVVLAGQAEAHAISSETAQQILRVAAEVGYRPNIAAQRMRGVNSRILGVHTYGDAFPVSHHNLNHAYLLGIQLAAESMGYDLLLFTSSMQGDGRPSAFVDHVNRLAAADGAIVMGFRADHQELARLSAEGYPFVRIGRREIDGVTIPWVDIDYYQAAVDMVESLRTAGFPAMVYVGDEGGDERAAELRRGARATADQHRLPEYIVPRNELTGDFVATLTGAGPVTVVAESHPIAARVLQAADEAGIRTGSQLQLAVLDSPFSAVAESVYCAYVVEPRVALGKLAAQQLAEMIVTGPRPLSVTLPGTVTIARPAPSV